MFVIGVVSLWCEVKSYIHVHVGIQIKAHLATSTYATAMH